MESNFPCIYLCCEKLFIVISLYSILYISYTQDIHKKIQELNFQDCHTKIRQVDSQATVGNAVVVQVTGELSNRSGPLRRFMQTFVLAHQNPKQYYVHNDIFRYQDEVFRDLYGSEVDDSDSQSVARADEQPGKYFYLKLCRKSCNILL